MKTRNLLVVASMLLALFAHAQLPGDGAGSPGNCNLKNKHCETKNYPPASTIPGCSSARNIGCFGTCYRPSGQVNSVGYCEGQLLPGGSCPLKKLILTASGTFTGCVPSAANCDCDSGNWQTITGDIVIYRC